MKDTPARTIYGTFQARQKSRVWNRADCLVWQRTRAIAPAVPDLGPRAGWFWPGPNRGYSGEPEEAGFFPPVCAQRATLSPAWRLREIRGPPVCHHHRGGSPIGGVSGCRTLHGMPRTSLHPRRSARSGRRRPPSASRARRSVRRRRGRRPPPPFPVRVSEAPWLAASSVCCY